MIRSYYKLLSRQAAEGADQVYLKAVQEGDMADCQRMVDAKAKAAGYTVGPVYHGTNTKDTFREFLNLTSDDGFWFSDSPVNDLRQIKVFLAVGKLLVVDAAGQPWYDVQYDGLRMATDDLVGIALMKGYNSLRVDNVREGNMSTMVNDIVVFYSNQIKSADPVTYDDGGRVIPLSRRFNPSSNDIWE